MTAALSRPPAPSAAARLVRALFRGWQLARAGRLSPCRFTPTCSTYGIAAVEEYGALRGGYLTLRRICRCRPFGRYGYDPVPDRKAH